MRPTEIKLSKTARILIIEDDKDQRRLLVKFIRQAFACEILEAEDGLEGLRIMLQDKQVPSLVLLDLMLPYMSGVEFLNVIRGRTEFDEVPVVVCSSVADTSEMRGILSNCIQGYLVKPINKEKLLEKLVAALHPIMFRVDYQ